MFTSFSAAIAAATILYGENWYRSCTILPRYSPAWQDHINLSGYLVSTKQPNKGSIRA